MTFIASVVAKKGVAIIADSLVTSSLPILHYRKFLDHLDAQPKNAQGEISLNPADITALFKYEPIYTKDFEEKIFRFNNYTAVTTTGIAEINDKKIIDIVHDYTSIQNDIEDLAIPFETKLTHFCAYITEQVKEHLGKYEQIGQCVLIVTFYEKSTSTTHIHKATIKETGKSSLATPDYEYISTYKEQDWVRVVCDGQNKLSDNVLYGIGKPFYGIFPEVVKNILNKLTIPEGVVPENFIEQLRADPYFNAIFYSDVELLNLSELSLQQAVDLASLLMRLEVDFQKYTRDVPTVGGVIKLAIIDEHGFEFKSGHKIIPPRHITL